MTNTNKKKFRLIIYKISQNTFDRKFLSQYVTFILFIVTRFDRKGEKTKGEEEEEEGERKRNVETRPNRKKKSVICFFLTGAAFFYSHQTHFVFDYASDEKFMTNTSRVSIFLSVVHGQQVTLFSFFYFIQTITIKNSINRSDSF